MITCNSFGVRSFYFDATFPYICFCLPCIFVRVRKSLGVVFFKILHRQRHRLGGESGCVYFLGMTSLQDGGGGTTLRLALVTSYSAIEGTNDSLQKPRTAFFSLSRITYKSRNRLFRLACSLGKAKGAFIAEPPFLFSFLIR